MNRIIFHIDVNSAYLSWEAVDRLSKGDKIDLRTIPSVVGGDPKKRKGIVLAKSYPCKKFNINTGETLYSAKNKYNDLIIVPPRYPIYTKASKALIDLLNEYTNDIEQYSIDEVFLDATYIIPKNKSPEEFADSIRKRIKIELGFTVCIGISHNKLLAKMATDLRKPNFTNTLYTKELEKKLWPLHISKLFMVGPKTTKKLTDLGIYTIGELATSNKDMLKSILKSHGLLIWNYANGIESSKINNKKTIQKGMGNSTTISFDISDIDQANIVLLSLSENLAMRIREKDYLAQTISVSIKFSNMSKISTQKKISFPTDSTNIIYEQGKRLLSTLWTGQPIRQISIRVSDLVTDGIYQYSFFDKTEFKDNSNIDNTIDNLRKKFGKESIQRAVFIDSNIKPIQGGVDDDFIMMRSQL